MKQNIELSRNIMRILGVMVVPIAPGKVVRTVIFCAIIFISGWQLGQCGPFGVADLGKDELELIQLTLKFFRFVF